MRRTPEEARAHILDAATRVFAEHLPDTVGLKEIAREAGISHALVTHYFGTYAALVEAALERHFHAVRDALVPAMLALAAADADISTILREHRRAVRQAASDPSAVRLATWALLSGRVDASDFFPHRTQGLKLFADLLEARGGDHAREDIEFALVTSFCLAVGWAFGRRAFAGSLGRRASRELDEGFEERIFAMIDGFLRSSPRTRSH